MIRLTLMEIKGGNPGCGVTGCDRFLRAAASVCGDPVPSVPAPTDVGGRVARSLA